MADNDGGVSAHGGVRHGRRWRSPPAVARHHRHPVCAGCRLRRVALCAVLDDSELPDLQSIMVYRQCGPGEALMLEGDPATCVISILSGGVKLYKSLPDGRQQIVAYLMPGDCLFPPETGGYIFSVEALSDTEFCEFLHRDFNRLLDRYDKLKDHMRHIAYNALVAAHAHMLLLGRKNALERLCTFLVRLHVRTERWGGPTDPLHVPLQRVEIADYLGLSLETVSRTFSRLRAMGLIRISPHPEEVYLLDLPRIAAIAEGDGAPGDEPPQRSATRPRRRTPVAEPPPLLTRASPFF